MASLEFKGKPFVANHHYSVPFREIKIDPKKSLSKKGAKPSLDDNLVIHGDNLEALKALLPTYAGKIKCIYIDPPYNTGHEGWAYNDNVRAPFAKEWLGKVIGTDDMERHDKWLCMMMPRLILLRELLSDEGMLFVSIDDNEHCGLTLLLDEIFGETNRIASLVWHSKPQGGNDNTHIVTEHEYIVVYAKDGAQVTLNGRDLDTNKYVLVDEYEPQRGRFFPTKLDIKGLPYRPNLDYMISAPDGSKIYPGGVSETEWRKRKGGTAKAHDWRWRWSEQRFGWARDNGFVVFKMTSNGFPRLALKRSSTRT